MVSAVRDDWNRAQAWLTGRCWRWLPWRIRDPIAKFVLDRFLGRYEDPNPPPPGFVYNAEKADALADAHFELAFLCSRICKIWSWPKTRPEAVRHHFEMALELYQQSTNARDYDPTPHPWPSTKMGLLYTSRMNPSHNLVTAAQLFDTAHRLGDKHATYWLGRAYLNGLGVDTTLHPQREGLDLISQAAAGEKPVLRAMFEIAFLYEMGVEGVVRKNHPLAVEEYKAITLGNRDDADREYISDFARGHMKDNKDFHVTDNALDTYAGAVLSWEFAAQAFLFAGAAALSAIKLSLTEQKTCSAELASQTGYCSLPILLEAIPIIGMIVAILSLISSIHTWLQNHTQRYNALELYRAKLSACLFLAGPKSLPILFMNLRFIAFMAFLAEGLAVALHCYIFYAWFKYNETTSVWLF